MYSQNREEEAILKYFGDFKGTFLDLGANDGQTLSNTRALAELGWRGVLVEPAPLAFNKLKRLYENSKGCFYVYECAIGDFNGRTELGDSGSLFHNGDTSLVSTLVPIEKKRFERTVSYNPIDTKIWRWKTFLNKLSIRTFDFMSIDIEGAEFEWIDYMGKKREGVLTQMDFAKTKLVCVETNGDLSKKAKLEEILTDAFKLIYTSGENLIYAR